MGDNYNGGDDHISQWFGMNSNHHHHQQQQQQAQAHPQQYQGQPQQMIHAPLVEDRNNMFPVDSAPSVVIDLQQHQQMEGSSLNQQGYYQPPQYSDQSQPQPPAQQQAYQQQGYQQQGLYQQMPPQQYPQHQQYSDRQQRQRQSQGLNMELSRDNSTRMNSSRSSTSSYSSQMFNNNCDAYPSQQQTSMESPPMRVSHTQRGSGDKNARRTSSVASASSKQALGVNATAASIAMSRSKARSERKRTREKQRRDGVNRQFGELTKVLKRLELEEREEAERKARVAAGNDSSMSASLHSVRLPFIAPNNSVDLVACAIVHLQHLHRMSKRQQEDINRLDDELENAKKAGEDTATKLKEVLFNYQMPRPHLGMTNPSFNVGNSSTSNNNSSSSSNNASNVWMSNNNNNSSSSDSSTNRMMVGTNGNTNLAMNATASTPMGMAAVMAGGQQQKQQQQVMMMVPVMMNMNGTATVMGQGATMPGMMMQSTPGGSSSFTTNATPSVTQGATTAPSSIGGAPNSITMPQKLSPQQQPMPAAAQPMQQHLPYQVVSQQQQQQPLQQDMTNVAKPAPSSQQQQRQQQQTVVQLQQQYLQRQSQPISQAPPQTSDASLQQQQPQVAFKQEEESTSSVVANVNLSTAPTPQLPAAEPVKAPASSPPNSEPFAVALAAALSNLRGGKGEQQQQPQQQQLQSQAGAPAMAEVPHNASTFAHAAALGSAIAASPVPNPIAASGSIGPGNMDGSMPSVAMAPSANRQEGAPIPQGTSEVNIGDHS